MALKSTHKTASSEKALLENIVDSALGGRATKVNESFDKLIRGRVNKLIKEEKSRMANMIFSDHLPQRTLKEEDDLEPTYCKVKVIDPELFEKEKAHMPAPLQAATPAGVEIEPIKEKDAIELTKKFNSIEILDV